MPFVHRELASSSEADFLCECIDMVIRPSPGWLGFTPMIILYPWSIVYHILVRRERNRTVNLVATHGNVTVFYDIAVKGAEKSLSTRCPVTIKTGSESVTKIPVTSCLTCQKRSGHNPC